MIKFRWVYIFNLIVDAEKNPLDQDLGRQSVKTKKNTGKFDKKRDAVMDKGDADRVTKLEYVPKVSDT